MKSYKVNEWFYSLQGEGMRAGTANVFLRFTGCNMRCAKEAGPKSPGGFDCDTEFESGNRHTAEEIVDLVDKCWSEGSGNPESDNKAVICTGGEPGIQLDKRLIELLKERGFYVAIETNGSIDVRGRGIDWITVSPKVAEHAVRCETADEVKYVRGVGQAVPKPKCKADHQLLSPAFNGLTLDQESLRWCIELVEQNPEWRLCAQLHKVWNRR